MAEPSGEDLKIDIAEEFSRKITVHKNISQEIIFTTSEKLELCLLKNQGVLKSKKEWVTPLAILITLIATLVTTTFKDSFGLKANAWEAIFFTFSVICAIWFIKAVSIAIKNKNKGSIDDIIKQFKIETEKHSKNIE